ncbi:MAG: hypothetical protein Alpg2KO_08410 [Alphaproteobacteria bacterium]
MLALNAMVTSAVVSGGGVDAFQQTDLLPQGEDSYVEVTDFVQVDRESCYAQVDNCYVDENGWYIGQERVVTVEEVVNGIDFAEAGTNFSERMGNSKVVNEGAAVAAGVLAATVETVTQAFEEGYRSGGHDIVRIEPGLIRPISSYVDEWQRRGEEIRQNRL